MNPDEGAKVKTPGRILAIDDEIPVVEALTRMLKAQGYEVESATSGAEGIKLFKTGRHDLVLTDLRLGDMTGTDVLRAVKKIEPGTAAIILTGYATTESAVEAIKLGANDYLTKPVRMSELSLAVRNQMEAVLLSRKIGELNREVEDERDKLRRSVAELSLLKRLASRMMSALSYYEGFELILNFLVEEVKADVAVIYDFERGIARLSATSHPNKREIEQICKVINRNAEMLGDASPCKFESFAGVDLDSSDDPRGSIKSSILVPINQEDHSFGVLVAASRSDTEFQARWGDFAQEIASEASDFLSRVKKSVERQQHWTSAIVEHTFDGLVVMNLATNEYLVNPVARSYLEIPLGLAPTRTTIESRLGVNLDELRVELTSTGKEANPRRSTVHHSEIQWRGETLYLRLNVSLMPTTGVGEGHGMLLAMQDVTQERAVEEIKAKLMSNISHELRTPTAVLKEFISLIMDGVAGELTDSQREYIQIMQSNVERLARLIENLLTLARADNGGFTIILKPIALSSVVEATVSSLTPKLAQKGMKIVVNMEPDLPLVYADQDAITQILANLIENARKYSPENTTITLTTIAKGNRIQIAIADEGFGIPAGEHEVIFKRFHRLVDKNDPRFQEGVGLGLPLVKDLVNRHGGDIWLTSEIGKGTTFYITLQIAAEDEDYRPA